MAPRRSLRPTLSNTTELSSLQMSLLKDVAQLEEEAASTRTPLCFLAKDYQIARADPDAVLQDLMLVKQHLAGCTEQEAIAWAKDLLKAKDPKMLGMHFTCIVQWRFDAASMWRGLPDNTRVLKFCRSIISSRFRQDACIAARSLDMSTKASHGMVLFQLLFGDGSARGVAAMIVWTLMVRRAKELSPDSGVTEMVESLWAIPTSFEEHGDGSERAALIAQAARQNQAAQVLPVSTLEWIGMIKDYSGVEIGASSSTRAAMMKKLEEMIQAYNSHPDVAAYSHAAPPAKRQRSTKGAKATAESVPDEGYDMGLRVGVRRLTAMKNFLSGGTQVGYDLLRNHLLWVSDYKLSVISDDIMMRPWFWVGSSLPKDQLPSGLGLASQEACAVKPDTIVPKGCSHALLQYDAKLTTKQFELMLAKAIHLFEDQVSHLNRDDLKAKAKPKEETSAPHAALLQFPGLGRVASTFAKLVCCRCQSRGFHARQRPKQVVCQLAALAAQVAAVPCGGAEVGRDHCRCCRGRPS